MAGFPGFRVVVIRFGLFAISMALPLFVRLPMSRQVDSFVNGFDRPILEIDWRSERAATF